MTILQLKIASTEVHHTAIIVLGAVLGRLCKAELCHDEVGKAAISFLSHGAAHADDTTLLPFLIGLANAHIPSSVPVLLRHAAGASPQAAALSMAALQRLPAKFISAEAQISLLAISRGEGSTHDPAIRILAIETLLMSEPPYDIVRALLADLHNATSEMARFVLAKVAAMIRASHPVSLTIQKALRDPFIKNYDFFSRDGLSSACWGFISQANASNITYNLDILFSTNGLMRRSNMDVILQGHRDALLVSQVTLEAEGLQSIFGEGLDAGGEDTDATARMSALLFGVQLKPVEFFRGYGDLLSKIWSSTGEPTTAVKGLLSLSRHQQELVLGSGLTLILHGDVALGIDITGNIDVSIWNAKSKTVISSKGAVVVLATAAVVTENWKKGVEVTTDAEVQFDTTTTVHFSRSPYLICLQMERSTFPYREKMVHFSAYQKEEHVLESKRVRVVRIPGAELPLHPANSEMCKQMFATLGSLRSSVAESDSFTDLQGMKGELANKNTWSC
uniref:Microsomal triglyceride transfer protein large subunit n=1 Tax=Eptatretus burgeri TaxID=7764 RepID=A0A8C4RAH1_EPTBU